ncbi:MAG: metallophosphoesterase [Opitutae bacterium]|nr:metallophosphoesterase [Opitutae bacterium]
MKLFKLSVFYISIFIGSITAEPESKELFGEKFSSLDHLSTGEWWKRARPPEVLSKKGKPPKRIIELKVPRDEVVAFALYTQDGGTLKLTGQLYPLMPNESREVRLETKQGKEWKEIGRVQISYPGWSAHFRVKNWDSTQNVPYRVKHGEKAYFEGLIHKDPVNQDTIVVGNLSCNSSRTKGPRPQIIENLKAINPDMLFFAGDQTYHHTEHTAGWIEFGLQFRDLIKDRPTVTIPDDHDVGQGNLWGESGIQATSPAGNSGGYFYPIPYVNMVQRQQTWHLPDPVDPKKLNRGLEVYFTRLRVGGIDFAILEDRKFKTGPNGKIPKMGPRPDHINDPAYDRDAVNLEGLVLLGERQLKFLSEWSQNWEGSEMKAALSQTAFCGAVHIHGGPNSRLLADLDSNAWPQKGRNKALHEIRKAWAPHLCGDQHLGVVVQHGIDSYRDGPFAFTSPAIVNTIYGRWWKPEDEKPGARPIPNSPLPWTGDFEDGLGNKITMLAYANPEDRKNELKRADGFGVARFNKKDRSVPFECWPRFSKVSEGDQVQFPGWPITFKMNENDGRQIKGWLPKLIFAKPNPVVQVIENKSGEVLYTVRIQGTSFQPKVYSEGGFTIKAGSNSPKKIISSNSRSKKKKKEAGNLKISI